MRNISKITVVFVVILTIVSCVSSIPISEAPPKNNATYEVSYLFEHEGCKVYRFYDRGDYVYFTNCCGNVTSFTKDSTRQRIQNKVVVE